MSHILYHCFICNNRKIKVAFGKMNDIKNNGLIFIGILTFYREFYILHNTRNRIINELPLWYISDIFLWVNEWDWSHLSKKKYYPSYVISVISLEERKHTINIVITLFAVTVENFSCILFPSILIECAKYSQSLQPSEVLEYLRSFYKHRIAEYAYNKLVSGLVYMTWFISHSVSWWLVKR